MGETPFVSIIIPTRNRVTRLLATLEALRLQDYPKDRYAIAVVDDGSTDGTREGVERVSNVQPAVQYLRAEGHCANAARNLGIEATEGDLVCIIDDDVLPPTQWLRKLVATIVAHGVEVSWGPIFLPPELDLPGCSRSELGTYLTESAAPEIPVFCNMIARRAVFHRGLFDPKWFGPVEEVEWILRTQPSRVFAAEAWLWHNKSRDDCGIPRLMRHAWNLGRESGRFHCTRLRGGFSAYLHAVAGLLRSAGHVVKARCKGGMVVTAGRAGYVYGFALAALRGIGGSTSLGVP